MGTNTQTKRRRMGFKFSFHCTYTSIFYGITYGIGAVISNIFYTYTCVFFFQDLLNFDDPLNRDAADLFIKDKESFRSKVKDYVMQYAKR